MHVAYWFHLLLLLVLTIPRGSHAPPPPRRATCWADTSSPGASPSCSRSKRTGTIIGHQEQGHVGQWKVRSSWGLHEGIHQHRRRRGRRQMWPRGSRGSRSRRTSGCTLYRIVLCVIVYYVVVIRYQMASSVWVVLASSAAMSSAWGRGPGPWERQ